MKNRADVAENCGLAPILTQFVDFLYPVESIDCRGIAVGEQLTEQARDKQAACPYRACQRHIPYWRTVNVASVAERVIEIVAEQLGVDKEKITPETSFVNDLGADSLDTVELVMELEEEFDINIPDDAAEKIQTVGQAIKFIEEAQNT